MLAEEKEPIKRELIISGKRRYCMEEASGESKRGCVK